MERGVADHAAQANGGGPQLAGTAGTAIRPIVDLAGKRGLVFGIANDRSIASGCASCFRQAGAELAASYLNDKARPHVEPVATGLDIGMLAPLDVREPGQMEAFFDLVAQRWGRIDFLLHSIAFALREDLHGRLTDCSSEGFSTAMDVSSHSFVRMARLAEPLMPEGGSLMCLTFYGSRRVVDQYSLMGPVKAALESTTRYLAAELGPKGIRVNAISPGPILTRASSGIANFDDMLSKARNEAPLGRETAIEDVGPLAAFLASDAARAITGTVIPVDCGWHLTA